MTPIFRPVFELGRHTHFLTLGVLKKVHQCFCLAALGQGEGGYDTGSGRKYHNIIIIEYRKFFYDSPSQEEVAQSKL